MDTDQPIEFTVYGGAKGKQIKPEEVRDQKVICKLQNGLMVEKEMRNSDYVY